MRRRRSRSPIAILGLLAACTVAEYDSQGRAIDSQPATIEVAETGAGPVRAGMSVAEGEAALGSSLGAPVGMGPDQCRIVAWPDGPPGLRLMIEGSEIVRIDVDSGNVTTSLGARVGDTEERIKQLYAGRVTPGPHKYSTGHYLTVTPADAADSAFRLVFETDGKTVTRYRAGKRPQVEYVEGCG